MPAPKGMTLRDEIEFLSKNIDQITKFGWRSIGYSCRHIYKRNNHVLKFANDEFNSDNINQNRLEAKRLKTRKSNGNKLGTYWTSSKGKRYYVTAPIFKGISRNKKILVQSYCKGRRWFSAWSEYGLEKFTTDIGEDNVKKHGNTIYMIDLGWK